MTKNVKALVEFRLKGAKVKQGEVIAKDAFASKGDWQNLAHMTPPRVEETDEPVGKPKAEVKAKAKLPGA